ncbi:hypothetical protein V6N12_028878 [Hibiscus sabdariffa]|uniref:Uncharacterized protein n=1 Tax=Hibiscus sabdariffa TaxID=183260 RepID=A0ABR2F758_9ROSI
MLHAYHVFLNLHRASEYLSRSLKKSTVNPVKVNNQSWVKVNDDIITTNADIITVNTDIIIVNVDIIMVNVDVNKGQRAGLCHWSNLVWSRGPIRSRSSRFRSGLVWSESTDLVRFGLIKATLITAVAARHDEYGGGSKGGVDASNCGHLPQHQQKDEVRK